MEGGLVEEQLHAILSLTEPEASLLNASLLAPLPLASARSPQDLRPESPAFPISSPFAGQAVDAADRIGLGLDVCEEVPVPISLQPLLDEGSEHDLQAHRELARRRRLPPQDPRPAANVSGEDEQDPGLVLEHHAASPACRPSLLTRRTA